MSKLLLNPPFAHKTRIRFLAGQIQARQKAEKKLKDWVDNPNLIFPKSKSVEQASSSVTAEYKSRFVSGSTLVDLTGGMGIDCLTLAKHFEQAYYVEQDADLCEIFRHNALELKRNIKVRNVNAEDFLKNFEESACTFYIDPARRDDHGIRVYKFRDCSPDVTELIPIIKRSQSKLIVKASPMIDLRQGISELGGVSEIHVLSIKNECKEVLFILDPNRLGADPLIHCFHAGQKSLTFLASTEKSTQLSYADPERTLLIPNNSILKAGGFKVVAREFGIKKISSQTHVYTSRTFIPDFPGRQFEIIEQKADKKNISRKGMMNVISKNFPLTAQQILKQFKLKEGGDEYLIGLRNKENQPMLLIVRPLESPESKG